MLDLGGMDSGPSPVVSKFSSLVTQITDSMWVKEDSRSDNCAKTGRLLAISGLQIVTGGVCIASQV